MHAIKTVAPHPTPRFHGVFAEINEATDAILNISPPVAVR
jgi:hypothetical protein